MASATRQGTFPSLDHPNVQPFSMRDSIASVFLQKVFRHPLHGKRLGGTLCPLQGPRSKHPKHPLDCHLALPVAPRSVAGLLQLLAEFWWMHSHLRVRVPRLPCCPLVTSVPTACELVLGTAALCSGMLVRWARRAKSPFVYPRFRPIFLLCVSVLVSRRSFDHLRPLMMCTNESSAFYERPNGESVSAQVVELSPFVTSDGF